MAIIMVKTVNGNNFAAEVTDSAKPVLVDFYASWCGPCKMLAPVIEELSNESVGEKVTFVKLDIDESPEIAERFTVMSVPTVVLFVNGTEVQRMVGVQPKEVIADALNECLSIRE